MVGERYLFVPLPPSGERRTSPRPWLPWLKRSGLLPPPPYSVGGINPCSGYPLGHTLLGQGLCLPKSGYMLSPPYSESQGAYYFLGSSQDNGAIIVATSGLRPLPVYFSSICCHSFVLSWLLGTSHCLSSSLFISLCCLPFVAFSYPFWSPLLDLSLSLSTSIQACGGPQKYLGTGVFPGLSHMLCSSPLVVLESFSPPRSESECPILQFPLCFPPNCSLFFPLR